MRLIPSRLWICTPLVSLGLLLSACGETEPAPAPTVAAATTPAPSAPPAPPAPEASAPAPAAPSAPNFQAWEGTWTGPEGTALQLVQFANGNYGLVITDLDGEHAFEGSAEAGGIRFERDGIQELLHATDGEGTGMKWLADERNCLTVKEGEGFCRR